MTRTEIAFAVIMVLNMVWFGLAFHFFSVRPVTVAKLLVPRGERNLLLFGTVM